MSGLVPLARHLQPLALLWSASVLVAGMNFLATLLIVAKASPDTFAAYAVGLSVLMIGSNWSDAGLASTLQVLATQPGNDRRAIGAVQKGRPPVCQTDCPARTLNYSRTDRGFVFQKPGVPCAGQFLLVGSVCCNRRSGRADEFLECFALFQWKFQEIEHRASRACGCTSDFDRRGNNPNWAELWPANGINPASGSAWVGSSPVCVVENHCGYALSIGSTKRCRDQCRSVEISKTDYG